MPWYYACNNHRLGPVSDAEFARLAREKTIQDDTLVWQHGMPDWKTYAEVAPTLPVLEAPLSLGAATSADIAAILAENPVPLHYAGFWVRAGAKLIDLFILNVLVLIAAAMMGKMPATTLVENLDDFRRLMDEMASLTKLLLTISLVYSWFFVWRFQGTPGKLVFGLKIVLADGSPLDHSRILFRFMAEVLNQMLFSLGYLLAATDEEKRTMHDYICNTRVVYKRR